MLLAEAVCLFLTFILHISVIPTAYIWYRTGDSLQDWSPWYQQLVSSEKQSHTPMLSKLTRISEPLKSQWKGGGEAAEKVKEDSGRVEYCDNLKNHYTLTINGLQKDDTAEYIFRLRLPREEEFDFPGVTLVVSDLKVTMTPSAEVTEGQRVTLTCSTSCPLTVDKNYFWYLNSRPLTLPENQSKHLVLDPVSSWHAGNYSCAVKTQRDIRSPEEILTVQVFGMSIAAINAVRLAVVLLIPVPLLLFHLWLRWTHGTRTSHSAAQREQQNDNLQVEVIPTTEEQTVSLMCSTSCPLTEIPAAYIWYKNREFLYQDWSPWYQQLVSSEEAVTYSCAIKGYEDLRAPEVSVDSVTSTCFSVTYAKGRMCSYQQKSEDEPCSITYPTEVHVQKTPEESYIMLKCTTSCPLLDPQRAYRWYQGGYLIHSETQQFAVSAFTDKKISCAIKGHEDMLSAEVCIWDKNCWRVNYVSRMICALQGSSVNISSEYSYPQDRQSKSKFWYKLTKGEAAVIEAAGRVEYHDSMKNHHILRIDKLKKNDSAKYIFRVLTDDGGQKQSYTSGVTLVITDLKVKFTPSAVVTEGQRVTLTCSTSCPLTDDTVYLCFSIYSTLQIDLLFENISVLVMNRPTAAQRQPEQQEDTM
ncbi:uncharacterized protein AKAME5_002621900 [Lates japonicus]|uniref:Ig-like domain-containing protein n=1 Tax=Lates japonicus TaxID=270547 RepID=A0AAD3NMZ4_LATJO|nr:uncharacterized protein AKAME5_002621900 [Lates japonicus]